MTSIIKLYMPRINASAACDEQAMGPTACRIIQYTPGQLAMYNEKTICTEDEKEP